MKTRLIFVGGFLGAGKTTLLHAAAQRLAQRGRRVGLITNDQAPELVDTVFLARGEAQVAEVSGSCFCCNFQGLLDAMGKVQDQARADVLIAEPVGSCTDLSATIIQPLKEKRGHEFAIAPLSVLVDPMRLTAILDGKTADLHPSAAYIFRKQMEEADIIVINKIDMLSADAAARLQKRLENAFPGVSVCTISAINGTGLDAWLDVVLQRVDAGQCLAVVDYDTYAEGEAVLGWLNATASLHGEATTAWNTFAETLLNNLSQRCAAMAAPIGHVKLAVETEAGFLMGNLTGTDASCTMQGDAGTTADARLTLNARVQMSPEALAAMVREVLQASCGSRIASTPGAWRCLSPGRPNPTHRYDHVVA